MKKGLSSHVLKVMSLFSGLQMLNIVCSVVKMKLVALWLHASGVGLFGIYQSVIDNISTFSELGIRQSAVREAACASGRSRMAVVAGVVRRWSLLAGLLGAVVMMGASPFLGKWFFGSYGACWGFMLLAAAMVFNSLVGGEQALLQGSARLRQLARSNLWGTLSGLALSVPLFYYCGATGVVLSIMAYAAAMYVCVRVYRLRTPKPSPAVGLGQLWHEGRGFIRLGVYMALASFVPATAHTVFIGIINHYWGTGDVGYIQAGDTVLVRYVGLVFTAIGMEFYPRLASVRDYPRRTSLFVNHEITLLLLLLVPLLLLFLLLREPVVRLLYTSDFLVILPFISWGVVGSIPKAVSWCMAYTIIARGDGRIYVLTEGLDAVLSVPLCVFAYARWGFAGLGAAYIAWYILYAAIVGAVYYRRYGLRLTVSTWRLILVAVIVCVSGLLAVDTLPLYVAAPLLVLSGCCFLPPLRRMLKR